MVQPTTTNNEAVLRTMQIIAAALVSGVTVFAAVAAYFGLREPPPEDTEAMIAYVAVAATLLALIVWAMVPSNLAPQGQSLTEEPAEGDEGAAESQELGLYRAYQTQMIVRNALLEGAAFLNLIAVIIDHQWWNLALAGVLVLLMALTFPTQGRVEQFVKSQREWMDLQRRRS